MDNFDKPYKDYPEMIEILKNRNVIIQNEDQAKMFLSELSYYGLINACKRYFPTDNEIFLNRVYFEEFIYSYMLENQFNTILLRYILFVERSFKSNISHIVSKKYGIYLDLNDIHFQNKDSYLCNANYSNSAQNVISSLKSILEELNKYKEKNLSIKHYLKNHNHLPLWIVMNCLNLGTVANYYQILKKQDKQEIADIMVHTNRFSCEEKKKFLLNGVRLITKYRNSIAHGQEIYANKISRKLPKDLVLKITNRKITKADYLNGIGSNDKLSVLLVLCTILVSPFKKMLINDIHSLEMSFNEIVINNKNAFKIFNLPDDYIEILNNI